MRHRVDGRKFGRDGSSRKAMFRNLLANLVMHGRIITTDAKAKELRRVAERLITKAKKVGKAIGKGVRLTKAQRASRLAAYRAIRRWLPMEAFDSEGVGINLAGKLLDEIAPRYLKRNGGYTRIYKIGNRRGDNAPLSLIEFVPAEARVQKDGEATKKKPRRSPFLSRSKKESVAEAG